jgi:hypothetical protein
MNTVSNEEKELRGLEADLMIVIRVPIESK